MAKQPKKSSKANSSPKAIKSKLKSKDQTATARNAANLKPSVDAYVVGFLAKLKAVKFKLSKPDLRQGIELFVESLSEPLMNDCGAFVKCYFDPDYSDEGVDKFVLVFSRESTTDMSDCHFMEFGFTTPMTKELRAIYDTIHHTRYRHRTAEEFRTGLREELPQLEAILQHPGPWKCHVDLYDGSD